MLKKAYNWLLTRLLQPIRWRTFIRKNPHLSEYSKPYQAPDDLVNKLVAQGLSIPNTQHASKVIFRQNYFRLKAYFIPFLDANLNQFYAGSSFPEIEDLYAADQKIRDFLLPLLAELEVRIRSVLDNVLTSSTNDPFWHLNPTLFINYDAVERALSKAESRFLTGKQEFVVHYKGRYFTRKSYRFRRLPPFWILSEIFTLEQLLSLARSLNKDKFALSKRKNQLNECATPFGFDSYDSLITNIKCLLELRNICAHHSRVWNKNLQAPSAIGKLAPKAEHANRLYSQLVMLRHMCKSQGIPDTIQPFFSGLFASVPIFQRDMASMGFPVDWDIHPFWK